MGGEWWKIEAKVGSSLLESSAFARWVGIIAAVIAGIGAIYWMPFYPIWSFVYNFIAALVIYALAAYGGNREAQQDSALR